MEKLLDVLKAIFVSKFWIKAISFLIALYVVILLNI